MGYHYKFELPGFFQYIYQWNMLLFSHEHRHGMSNCTRPTETKVGTYQLQEIIGLRPMVFHFLIGEEPLWNIQKVLLGLGSCSGPSRFSHRHVQFATSTLSGNTALNCKIPGQYIQRRIHKSLIEIKWKSSYAYCAIILHILLTASWLHACSSDNEIVWIITASTVWSR